MLSVSLGYRYLGVYKHIGAVASSNKAHPSRNTDLYAFIAQLCIAHWLIGFGNMLVDCLSNCRCACLILACTSLFVVGFLDWANTVVADSKAISMRDKNFIAVKFGETDIGIILLWQLFIFEAGFKSGRIIDDGFVSFHQLVANFILMAIGVAFPLGWPSHFEDKTIIQAS